MKSMLNTNVTGFIFSEIKNDETYWGVFRDVCYDVEAYSYLYPKDSNSFRCYVLLLERKEIINVLKQVCCASFFWGICFALYCW